MSNIQITTLTVGQLAANCYLIFEKNSKKTTIIDPGDDADYILRKISDLNLIPEKIIATHGHFDHIMAAAEVQLAYDIPFFIHQKDEFLVRSLNKSAQRFISVSGLIPPNINQHLMKHSDQVSIANTHFQLLHTPGHTPGSVSLYSSKESILLPGDVIFAGGGVGRYDFSYSNKKNLYKSVDILLQLPPQTTLYPGHGPISTIDQERPLHE